VSHALFVVNPARLDTFTLRRTLDHCERGESACTTVFRARCHTNFGDKPMPFMFYGAILASLRQGCHALDLTVGRAQWRLQHEVPPLRGIVGVRLAADHQRQYGLPWGERVCTGRPRLRA
jgi:hypothetical protein